MPTGNNPVPPSIHGARTYARSFAEKAIDTLVYLMEQAKSEHVRLSAAKELIKLGCGKAIKPGPDDLSDGEAEAERQKQHERRLASERLFDLFRHERRQDAVKRPYVETLSDRMIMHRLKQSWARRDRRAAEAATGAQPATPAKPNRPETL